jgi:hypothetical protein
MEKESATLRNWLSGIISLKGAIAESGNNLVSINKPREVTIDVSLPIASDVEQKKTAPSDPRKTLPESPSGGRIPTGCPYDLKLAVNEDTESWLSVHKHTECDPDTGAGNGVFERYATIFSNGSESGLWAYFGQDADFSLKAKVEEDQASYNLYNIDSSSYFGSLVKSNESSFWGYASDHNYKIKADLTQVQYRLWNENGDYFSTLVKSNESSFLGSSNSGYNYKTIADPSKASIEAYGNGKFIIISTEDLTDAQSFAKFREVMGGDMVKRFFLCTDPSDGADPQCGDLADPLVRNIYAQYIGSHPDTGPCVGSETYVDFAKSFIQVATVDDPSIKVTVEPNKIEAVDGTSYRAEHAANYFSVISNDGDSELADTFLHINKTSGSHATFSGEGWLQLKNAAGKVVDLNSEEIVFTDGSKTATHDADGYTAIDGSSNFAYYRADVANLVTSSNEGSFRADRLELTQTSGDVSAILSVNSGSGTLSVENSNGGKGTYQATLAKLEDSLGDSTLTTQSLHLNGSAGSHATFNGAGWLELKSANGDTSYLKDRLTISSGNFSGSSELWPGTLKLYGASSSSSIILEHASSSAEINMNGQLGSVGIRTADLTGTKTFAKFRQVKVCVNDEEKKAWVLMTEPE